MNDTTATCLVEKPGLPGLVVDKANEALDSARAMRLLVYQLQLLKSKSDKVRQTDCQAEI